jgi:hypothetical protein
MYPSLMAVAHSAGSSLSPPLRSWGSATLHPRLYVIAALRGLNSSFLNESEFSFLSKSKAADSPAGPAEQGGPNGS